MYPVGFVALLCYTEVAWGGGGGHYNVHAVRTPCKNWAMATTQPWTKIQAYEDAIKQWHHKTHKQKWCTHHVTTPGMGMVIIRVCGGSLFMTTTVYIPTLLYMYHCGTVPSLCGSKVNTMGFEILTVKFFMHNLGVTKATTKTNIIWAFAPHLFWARSDSLVPAATQAGINLMPMRDVRAPKLHHSGAANASQGNTRSKD